MTKRQAGRHSKNVGSRFVPTGKKAKRDAKRLRVWAERGWRKAVERDEGDA